MVTKLNLGCGVTHLEHSMDESLSNNWMNLTPYFIKGKAIRTQLFIKQSSFEEDIFNSEVFQISKLSLGNFKGYRISFEEEGKKIRFLLIEISKNLLLVMSDHSRNDWIIVQRFLFRNFGRNIGQPIEVPHLS